MPSVGPEQYALPAGRHEHESPGLLHPDTLARAFSVLLIAIAVYVTVRSIAAM